MNQLLRLLTEGRLSRRLIYSKVCAARCCAGALLPQRLRRLSTERPQETSRYQLLQGGNAMDSKRDEAMAAAKSAQQSIFKSGKERTDAMLRARR